MSRLLQKVREHGNLFAKQLLTIGMLLAFLLTPFVSKALVDPDNLKANNLMNLVNPEQTDMNALARQQKVDKFVLRYMREELGLNLTQEDLNSIVNDNNYMWFSSGSDSIPELMSRREVFMQNYEAIRSFVLTMDQVAGEVVMSSTTSNASLADAPVDSMILLEQKEKLYEKILQVLELQYKILQLEKVFVTLKMVFMPKLEVKPSPHLTLCSSYQGMEFPSLLDAVEIPMPALMEELAGIYEGYVENYADIVTSFEEKESQIREQLASGEEFVPGGWKEEVATYLKDRNTSLEQEQELCDGNLTAAFAGGSSDLTNITTRQKDACAISKTFKEGVKKDAAEEEENKATASQQGGEAAGKLERYTETMTETMQSFLENLMLKINTLKPSM